jgi:glycosyltransferase involved in cell wall biosynthesis
MKHILITAYDVNPYRGSESATGWNYPYHLSKYNKITVVTRENNLPNIYKYIAEKGIDVTNMEFIGFDLPIWARFWKKGVRGSFLYFYLWQLFLGLSFYSKRKSYDICHSLNFHCDWAPSFLWLLGKPFIWGPINHNEKLPDYILNNLSQKKLRTEKIKLCFKYLFWKVDPFLYLCKTKASKILVGHNDVIKRLNLAPNKCVLFNQIATDINTPVTSKLDDFNILFVGRGLLLKNYEIILDAFKLCITDKIIKEKKLTISFIGVGKDAKEKLLIQAEKLEILNFVQIEDWVPFEEMNTYYSNASTLCFPSFEGAGMVIAEALSHGVPVITIDKNGASHELDTSCSFIVDSSSKGKVIMGISEAFTALINDDDIRVAMSSAAHVYAKENLSWSAKSKKISNIYSLMVN